jgi:hypothetical protein
MMVKQGHFNFQPLHCVLHPFYADTIHSIFEKKARIIVHGNCYQQVFITICVNRFSHSHIRI